MKVEGRTALATLGGIGVALCLTACVKPSISTPDSRPTNDPVAQHRTQAAAISSQAAIDLVLAAATSRQTMEGFSGYAGVTAVYVGQHEGCAAITVKNRDFHKTDHYLVCRGQIQARREVAPAPPSIGDIDRRARHTVKRQAYQQGQSVIPYQGYRYRARRVGLPDARGCSQVEMILSYDGLLVDRTTSRICPAQ